MGKSAASDSKPVAMNKQSGLLLRSLVAHGDSYEEQIDKFSLERAEAPSRLSMLFDSCWHDGFVTDC